MNRLLVIGLAALSTFAHAQVDPQATVVTINGEAVKGDEYYHRMEYLTGVGKRAGNAFAELPPGLMTLDQIITERLVMQLAKEKGVYPSDLEITTEINDRLKDNPGTLDIWTKSGRTEAEWRGLVIKEICEYKLVTFGVTVTDQDVDNIYKTRGDEFTTPKQYKLSVVVVLDDAAKNQVDADLKAKRPFTEIAKQYSQDVTKVSGGQYGTVPESVFAPAIKTALAQTKPGQTTQWIESRTGDTPNWIKFYVDDIVAAQKQPLTPDLRKYIRRKRALELGGVKNNIGLMMGNMRRKSNIAITNPLFADAYKKYVEAYLSQPSAGGGS